MLRKKSTNNIFQQITKAHKAIILTICILTAANYLRAQQNDEAQAILTTPFNTINTHITYLDEDNYHPDIAAKVFNPDIVGQEDAENLAIELLQVYKGMGILIDFSTIPNKPNYKDTISNTSRYIISTAYPEIYLEKVGSNWYYSKVTTNKIKDYHRKAYPFGVGTLLVLLPKLGTEKYFGLHLWQLIGILIITILCVFIHKLFTFIIEKIVYGILTRYGYTEVVEKHIAPVARPLSILIVFPILMILVPVLQLPLTINNYVIISLKILWPIFATLMFYRLVDFIGLYLVKLAQKTESTLDDQLVPLLRKTLKIFVVIIGGLAILSNLNIDIIPLLTGLSIGGLAFALAAQDTLKNLFGSIMIFLDRPFQVGDWITAGDIDGTVEEVGFRATRIRTFRNSLMYVPNAKLADSEVDNHGLRTYRRFYTTIGITYDTPPEVIGKFIEGLRKVVENHPHTRKDYYNIFLNDFGPSSLDIMLYIFFVAKDWTLELQYRQEIILEAIKLAENMGVRFAFPTQTLHIEAFPEKKGATPVFNRDPEFLDGQLNSYFNKPKNPN